jgi:hypothetical protein
MTNETSRPPNKIKPEELRRDAKHCAVLILAAGFEDRARRVLDILGGQPISRVVLVRYPEGIEENDDMFAVMRETLSRARSEPTVETVLLDLRRPDEYLMQMKATLTQWRPDSTGEVWVDVSAMAMQGICATLAAVRGALPGLIVQVLYTEAAEYHPTKAEVAKGDASIAALSKEMAENLIPKHFAGASSAVSTCLIVFAGYEKHRSVGVVDELNPSRLVLVYGKPPGNELKWRLQWSRKLHEQLHENRQCASEMVSTLNPLDSLSLLNSYYGYLFDDHNIAVSPICSKMQCVACYLFWERYPDVQLVFPLPVTYLPKSFSKRHRYTFRFTLPSTSELATITKAPL